MQQQLSHGLSAHCPLPSSASCLAASCSFPPLPARRCRGGARRLLHMVVRAAADNEGNNNSEWINRLNRNSIAGPEGPQPPIPTGKRGIGYDLMGEEGYPRYVENRKAERQRGGWGLMRGAVQACPKLVTAHTCSYTYTHIHTHTCTHTHTHTHTRTHAQKFTHIQSGT